MRRFNLKTAARGLLGCALLLAAASALADLALADKSTCLNCHAVDKKLVGPSFSAIAAKYRGQPEAVAALRTKVEKGSAGVWGSVPMPAMGYLPKDDVAAVVLWITKLP